MSSITVPSAIVGGESMSDRVRLLVLDRALLLKALSLPESTSLVDVIIDREAFNGPLILKIQDESFTPLNWGDRIPRVNVEMRSTEGQPEFVRYL